MTSHDQMMQARAEFALEVVHSWEKGTRAIQEVKGLPVRLRSMGLAQTVAWLGSEKELKCLGSAIAEWLLQKSPQRPFQNASSSKGASSDGIKALLNAVVQTNPTVMRFAEAEAMELTITMKLFSGAMHE